MNVMERFLEKLKHEDFTLTSIYDFIIDLVFLIEVDGDSFRYLDANQSAIKALSKTRFIGRRIEDVLEHEHAMELVNKFKLVQFSKKPINFIQQVTQENGLFIGETTLNPIITKNGQCQYIISIVRDITDRTLKERELKDTKKTLEKRQKRLNSLINNNEDLIFEIDLEGKIVRANPAGCQFSGYKEHELMGKPYTSIIVDEYLEETKTYFQKALTGNKGEYEIWVYNGQGQQRLLNATNVPIVVDGIIEGIYVIAKDITEKKQLQKRLKETQEKYKLIMDHAFDVIKLISPEGIIEYVSPSNEKILGYSQKEYTGQAFIRYIHPEDLSHVKEQFYSIINEKRPIFMDIRVLHKKGHYIWMETSTTPVIEDGEIKQLVTVARDITERKKLRDELEKAALYDSLSGIPNRRFFRDRLIEAIDQADCTKKKVALFMLDGNKFKQINDTYGHVVGDVVIKEMARRLQSCIRKGDIVARIGGDEFSILLPELVSKKEVEEIVKRILTSFEEPLNYKGKAIKMGVGIGIAFYPDQATNREQLVKYADLALYHAKEAETDGYQIFDANLLDID